jgi:hypothetical protein
VGSIPGGKSSPAKCPTKSCGGGGGSTVVAETEERKTRWTGEENQLVDSSPGFFFWCVKGAEKFLLGLDGPFQPGRTPFRACTEHHQAGPGLELVLVQAFIRTGKKSIIIFRTNCNSNFLLKL